MVKESSKLATSVAAVDISIGTANIDGSIDSSETGEIHFITRTNFHLPGFSNVIFAPKLANNLVSVGRLTEGGITVVFNATGSRLFATRGLNISGDEIHSEERDRRSGLYPLTVFHQTPSPKNVTALLHERVSNKFYRTRP
jgi:hypothetical protein